MEADFARFFHTSPQALPPGTAAAWAGVCFTQPESWVFRRINPTWWWDQQTELLAGLFDLTRQHVWMGTKDGAKGRGRPKPLPRPRPPRMHRELTPSQIDTALARPRIPATGEAR